MEAVASGDPTPGGGGAAAMGAALAAALTAMAARKAGRRLEDADELTGRAEELRLAALRLAPADARSYEKVLALARGPTEARRNALLDAARVPLEVARIASECAGMAERLAKHGAPALEGDARVGREMALGALRGAARLVRINVQEATRLSTREATGEEEEILETLTELEDAARPSSP